jgi:hypothetical protein
MADPNTADFERDLHALLRRAASQVAPRSDLTPIVRERLLAGARVPGDRTHLRFGAAVASLSTVLVIALLAGGFWWLRAGSLPSVATPTRVAATETPETFTYPTIPCDPRSRQQYTQTLPTPVAEDHSSAINKASTSNGITLRVQRAYADAAELALSYQVTPLRDPDFSSLTLTDETGATYSLIEGVWTIEKGGRMLFGPPAQEKLGSAHTYTLTVSQMGIPNPINPEKMVKGLWRVSFALTPVAGPSKALSNKPVTRNTVTLQPLQLDLAPAGGLDGSPGGARLVIRASGLPSQTTVEGMTRFNTLSRDSGGCSSNGVLLLRQADGTWVFPEHVVARYPAPDGNQQQTVDADGTMEFEAIFPLTMSQARGAALTLVLDHLQIETDINQKPTTVDGPWSFHITAP